MKKLALQVAFILILLLVIMCIILMFVCVFACYFKVCFVLSQSLAWDKQEAKFEGMMSIQKTHYIPRIYRVCVQFCIYRTVILLFH